MATILVRFDLFSQDFRHFIVSGRGKLGLVSYVDVAKRSGAEHRRIPAPRNNQLARVKGGKPRRAGTLGLGQVNAHHQRLKQFINGQARGVSTKHLPAYLGWSRAVRRPGFDPILLLTDPLIYRYI
jgi:hypothetical protein